MSKVYVTIPNPSEFPIVDPVTGEPLCAQERGRGEHGQPIMVDKAVFEPAKGRWGDAVRALTLDPRFEAETDIYERNEFRHALTRAKPGEIVAVDMRVRDAIKSCILKPQTLSVAFLYSGGAEMLRALLDAPSKAPEQPARQAEAS